MNLNEWGVFTDPEIIEIGNCCTFGVRVEIGEHEGKWGFQLAYAGRMHGRSTPFTAVDLIYSSRSEAMKNAREKVLSLNVISEFTEKMVDEIHDKLGAQLDLFGGEI